MKIRYQDDAVTLYQGEALRVLHSLDDNSFDALITDPPYSSGGTTATSRKAPTSTKYQSSDVTEKGTEFVGDARDQRAYQYWTALWLSEALRVARPGALAMLFTDWRQYAATADALQAGGWTWRGTLTWVKPPSTTRPQKGRFSQPCEYVLWGSKGARPVDHQCDDDAPSGWFEARAPRGADRSHITEKPVPLMRHLMRPLRPGSRILDPFTGSGTTGVAAKLEGHRFVGVEAVPSIATTAAHRLSQDALDLT